MIETDLFCFKEDMSLILIFWIYCIDITFFALAMLADLDSTA